jgi:hypothetical protein
MLLLTVGLLAFLTNDVVQDQRRRDMINTYKALKLAERNYLAKSQRHADDELRWIKTAKSWGQEEARAREYLREKDTRKRLASDAGSAREYPEAHALRRLATHTIRYIEWCRMMASRAGDLKRKYAYASAHPAEPITPDPPVPIEPRIGSLIDDLKRRQTVEQTVDWPRRGFPSETRGRRRVGSLSPEDNPRVKAELYDLMRKQESAHMP